MQFLGIGFLVLLFLEIMSIVWVADWIGGGATLLLMVVSFVSGVLMLRHTGLSGVLLAGAAVRSGQDISLYQMLWPIRYALAALMLMSPGFISGVFALLLLLPIKGRPVAQAGRNAGFQQHNPFARQQKGDNGGDDVIEGEYPVTRHEPSAKQQDYIEHKRD